MSATLNGKQAALIIRGSVDAPDEVDDDASCVSRVCHLGRLRRYHPGELVMLNAVDFLDLQRRGVVRAV